MGYPPITKRKRRQTTVGSIVVPELPWQRLRDIDREAAERVRRERDDPARPGRDYCNQVDCNCADPFHCT